MRKSKEAPFVFGVRVEGDSFTDRREETERLKANFTYGVNTILISPRRMGKTSLVDKVCSLVESEDIRIARIDAFGCRSENDFINAFATAVVRATSSKWEEWIENAKVFLSRFVPKISIGQDPLTDFSLALEYNAGNNTTEEVLRLPEMIARSKGCHIVVCIDEFQQIGEFPNSLDVQKRLRGVWQHHQNVSYCFFGSKRHLMENIFQSRRMPFYMFGEMLHLECIPTEYWVPFICSRFEKYGKYISEEFAKRICETVKNYSSYVQQLAWNVMAETEKEVNEECLLSGINALLQQCNSLFVQQTESLTTYQLNFIRLLCKGIHSGFTAQNITEDLPLGSKSNIDRIKKSLIDKEIIYIEKQGVFLADCVFELWFKKEMM